MKAGRTLGELAKELERQLAVKKDMIVPSALMTCRTNESGSCSLLVDESDQQRAYPISEHALRQLAEKTGIPFGYFERMRTEKPNLLDQNVNSWLHTEGAKNRMVRTLDGRVRAVLSQRYRRIDNYDLAEFILPILGGLPDAIVASAELTETRMYLKVVSPRITCEIAPGDIVNAGVAVCNSEIGHGALWVEPLIYRLVCSNGLIVSDGVLRKAHLGKVLAAEEDAVVVFKDDTLQADDKALLLKVRDMVEAAISDVRFKLACDKLRRSTGIKLTGDPVAAVEVLGNRFMLSENERTGVLRSLIEEHDLSAYGLVNAVTGYSQQLDDYDRATDFEVLGGKLLELSDSAWKEIAQAT